MTGSLPFVRQAIGTSTREARDVLVGEHVLVAVHRAERIEVDQVERLGQVHDEALAPLADEDAAVGAQPGICTS